MTTYAELVTQIRDYTETDDTVLSDTRVNDMIEHAEERIFRDVDLDVFRKTKYATLSGIIMAQNNKSDTASEIINFVVA